MALAASGWMKVTESPGGILNVEVKRGPQAEILYITVGEYSITCSVRGFMANTKISSIKSFGFEGDNLRITIRDGSIFIKPKQNERTPND